jgi:hypothetical protein
MGAVQWGAAVTAAMAAATAIDRRAIKQANMSRGGQSTGINKIIYLMELFRNQLLRVPSNVCSN